MVVLAQLSTDKIAGVFNAALEGILISLGYVATDGYFAIGEFSDISLLVLIELDKYVLGFALDSGIAYTSLYIFSNST